MVEIYHNNTNIASFIKDDKEFIIDYQNFDLKNSICLWLEGSGDSDIISQDTVMKYTK